ncbi:DUF3524 domain-containing protein [Puniceicoccaceae bacterium K14]|nr:DUF3524 domain-containing protein [Puniceicoccaceae bacterium K14]
MNSLRICLVEPFYGGSHKRWADELKRFSSHSIDILALPGRHWKWRMHGGAITLAQEFKDRGKSYDIILASDMLDLSLFVSLIGESIAGAATAIYFHENQLTYPWSPRDKDTQKGRDNHYAFINYSSALAADKVFFNSNYHKNSFLNELPKFLAQYPDFENKSTIQSIREKCETLHLCMDLKAFDLHKPIEAIENDAPTILWNHRWEYDKNPMGFFRVINILRKRRLPFRLALLGEHFQVEPPYFAKAKQQLSDKIIQYGHVSSFEEYASWLWRSDIALVTSVQDFFGGSVVESIYCNALPLLPNRLAYPEHITITNQKDCFYEQEKDLVEKLVEIIETKSWKSASIDKSVIDSYDWTHGIHKYDSAFEELASTKAP